MSTPKQASWFRHFLESYKEFPTVRHIFNNVPKNNAKYPDNRADYSKTILNEWIEQLGNDQIQYCVKALENERGYHISKAMNILTKWFDYNMTLHHNPNYNPVKRTGPVVGYDNGVDD